MGHDQCAGCTPYSRVTFQVTYCHKHQRYDGQHWGESLTDEGDFISHGSASRTFGPFDSYTDVQHWLASEARVLKTLNADGNLTSVREA